jgi:hypothetical protein
LGTETARAGRAFQPSLEATDWSQFIVPSHDEPRYATQFEGELRFPGLHDWGVSVGSTSRRMKIVPYSNLSPGETFSLRLWEWNVVGRSTPEEVWVPVLLVELLCTAGAIPGPSPLPPGVLNPYVIGAADNFCDQITLAYGNYGPEGGIWSAAVAGGGVPAFAVVEPNGPTKLQYDAASSGAMNAIYQRC